MFVNLQYGLPREQRGQVVRGGQVVMRGKKELCMGSTAGGVMSGSITDLTLVVQAT